MIAANDTSDSNGDLQERMESAAEACDFLKALANEQRLLILCLLAEGEMSVTELEDALDLRQSAVSQQLSRLRDQDLVSSRREGKAIYYSLSGDAANDVLSLLHKLFCPKNK